jgi:hypothetical protein
VTSVCNRSRVRGKGLRGKGKLQSEKNGIEVGRILKLIK